MSYGRFPTARRSSCSRFVRSGLLAAGLLVVCASLHAGAQAPAARGRAAAPETPLAAAARAESELRLDDAVARLYELLIEHPGTDEALAARPRLARLLTLSGHLQSAILQCQLLREELPVGSAARERALELASVLLRRLRASGGQQTLFPTIEGLATKGLPSLDEPRAMEFESDGRFVILDEGAKRVFRVTAEGVTQLSVPADPTAITVLPDGTVAVIGKAGLATVPGGRTVPLTGTWGGKTRSLRKVRSMAATSGGDLFIVDKDYDGVLRCQMATGACAPWGPVGKYRVVKVGASDWVYLLDEKGQNVRVVSPAQRVLASLGPMAGTTRLQKVEDIAVDSAYGLYLLDTDLKRVSILFLKGAGDGKLTAESAAAVVLPQDGDRSTRNPTTLSVSPGGWLAVTGKSAPRVMRLR